MKAPNVLKFWKQRGYSPKLLMVLSAMPNFLYDLLLYLLGTDERFQVIVVFRHFFYKNYVGLSLWPFIILKEDSLKDDAVLINHERIHLKQQRELLILPFYLLYVSEWLLRTILYMDSYRAYQNISFEREAYANEADMQYLSKRKIFGFLNYLMR